jgi:hypothetical protein
MVDVDTSVKDIAAGTLTRGAIIHIGVITRVYVRNASKTPWSIAVRKPVQGVDFGILLNPLYLTQYQNTIPSR